MLLFLKHLIVILMLNTGIRDPRTTTSDNLIKHPENVIYSLFDFTFDLPGLLTALFKELNNGTIPQWIEENTRKHNLLVSPSRLGANITNCYDFIVVGAGTAGSVVASRLSENPSTNVLLLEAGLGENILTDIPSINQFITRTSLDWGFETEPQNNCFLNMENQRGWYTRGKLMGGSSSINSMYYLRGFPRDYDNWADITRDDSWKYDNILQYFLKSEHNYDPKFCADTTYHNCNGVYPVVSNWKSTTSGIPKRMFKAAAEFGVKQKDLNRPEPNFNGTNGCQQSLVRGTRVSVSKAFLESVYQNRKNLDIITEAFVTQIIFSDNKAIGVKYDRLGATYSVYARKEVILSAGSIKSAHILLTSGVGPRRQLENFSIPVIADLPGVGENLHDHVYTTGIGYSVPSTGEPLLSINSFRLYNEQRIGPMAHYDEIQMIVKSSINDDPDWPDIVLNNRQSPFGFDPTGLLLRKVWNLKQYVYNRMYFPHFNKSSFLLTGGLNRPRSRGNLYLQSSDPHVYPLIQPNYLTHPDDVKILIEATRWTYRFEQTETFKEWNAKIFPELTVGCESVYKLVRDNLYPRMLVPSDQYLECHVRHMTTIFWHFVGTCKMSNVNDRMAVIDSQLRVLGGITGLRVIDSSVMPVVSTGNTNAPTMMIAEKGAQMIKDYYNI